MKTTSCTSFILLISFALCCGAMSIDLNKVREQYTFENKMDLNYQSKCILLCFFFSWFSKETPSTGATAELNRKWVIESFANCKLKYTNIFFCRIKRSTDELDNLLNEIFTDEEFLNYLTIHGVDKEKVQSSPILQYLLLRKPSLFINQN